MGEIVAAEDLKPFLLHEDRHVRGAVAGYFAQGWSADPSIVELILDACERYGEVENLTALSICRTLRQTPRGFARMLDRLAAVGGDEVARSAILDVIERVPWEAARAVAEERGGLPDLGESFARRMEWCAEFAALSGDALWQALSDYARACDDLRSPENADFDYSEDLIEALAAHGVPEEALLLEALGGGGASFAELFAVQLAGARRVSAAIPALIATYRGDVEVLAREATDALARIGDPRAVRLAREAFAAETSSFRQYAAGLFEALKAPESEDAAYSLLAGESDPVVRSLLCEALCMLFSRRGFTAACAELERGARSEELSFVLVPASVVLGLDLPEAARRWWEVEKSQPALAPEAPEDAEPYRRAAAKIGRNDPCPCGSGKKYKKCCGR